MTGEKAKRIFDLYNPKSDVVRCPYGRAMTRKLLDDYATAAVNLYGVISRGDFVKIFNKQNIDQTTEEEIYILLLPLVLKDEMYAFYKEYIVHYWCFDDFTQADYLLKHQAEKPRYVPDKEELLKYADEDYVVDNEHWSKVRRFMANVFGVSSETWIGFEEVRNCMTYGNGIRELGSILEKYNLIIDGDKQLQEFLNLISYAKNNTRIWENNGYTPSELQEIISKRDRNIIKFPKLQREKIGRNDPCPCGSGKVYKKCCAKFEDAKTAQLSTDDCKDFYETWYGLMGYVNERKKVVQTKIKPDYPNTVSDLMVHKVREVLWDNPELIDGYINETDLAQEKVDILKLWRKHFKKGMFIILEYQPEYAVALSSDEQGEDRLYGIKGISNSVANVMRRVLPTQMETVLLPFKGQIIYDTFMSSMPIRFGEGTRAAFVEMYDKAIERGIITNLD